VINSSLVMVDFLRRQMPGARLLVVGEASLCAELAAAGFDLTDDAAGVDARSVDAVIASFDREFTYRKLQTAFDAIRAGARFFATNGDRFCPTPTAASPTPRQIVPPLKRALYAVRRLSASRRHHKRSGAARLGLSPERCLMVGDRLETDVLFGLRPGMACANADRGDERNGVGGVGHSAGRPAARATSEVMMRRGGARVTQRRRVTQRKHALRNSVHSSRHSNDEVGVPGASVCEQGGWRRCRLRHARLTRGAGKRWPV
jgi:hypothetical protein